MKELERLVTLAVIAITWHGIFISARLSAVEHRNVKYVPSWRYSGDDSATRDGQMMMDIVVPEDGKPSHPVLFVVHGGGWSAGDKAQRIYRDIMQYFEKRGYVCVGLNYVMRPRGIFPQVFWDYADAARFLRKHADKYRVDPTRFGAIGLSAGGWLISSAGHGSGDLLCLNHQRSTHVAELRQRGWSRDDRHYEDTFARPMSNPQPAFPGQYGRFQAISYDFSFRTKFGSGNSPACNQWVGQGYQLRPEDQAAVDSEKFDYSQTVLTHPSFKGRKVHVPPLFSAPQKDGSNKAEAVALEGQRRVDAIERIHEFFQYELVRNPRTPMPEIQPARRIFESETEVSFIMPKMEAEIHYQVVMLKSAKGKQWRELYPSASAGEHRKWPRYNGPFKVRANCLVRAVASSEGRRDSTVAEAHFFSATKLPSIVSPDADELPPATTGKPYTVQFQSDTKQARWFLAGDLVPYSPRNQAHFTYPNNMVMNYQTGQWSGVPTKPGKYWIQVWTNNQPGAIASHRDYIWKVIGNDLSNQPEAISQLGDPHVKLLHLPGVKGVPAAQISGLLNRHGIPAIVQSEKQGALFLVDQDHRIEAQRLITAYLRQTKYKGPIQWQ